MCVSELLLECLSFSYVVVIVAFAGLCRFQWIIDDVNAQIVVQLQPSR